MNAYSPEAMQKLQTAESYSVAGRLGVVEGVLETWDGELLREPRVCVPVDVQALVVPEADPAGSEGVPLVGALSPGRAPQDGDAAHDTVAGPEPFAAPTPREPGVHLHWALPDSLLSGTLADPTASAVAGAPSSGPRPDGGGLSLPPLPDRWLVLRLAAAAQGPVAVQTGWVLDAGTGRAWPLPAWTGDVTAAGFDEVAGTAVVPPEGLTGTAGGTLTWTAGYDAASRRFAFHDPLTDLAQDPTLGGSLPGGPEGGRATYVVVGWWSRGDLDPLDEVRGSAALDRRLTALGWYRDPLPPASSSSADPYVAVPTLPGTTGKVALDDVGLMTAVRYGTASSTIGTATALAFAPGLLGGASLGRYDAVLDGPVRYVPPAKPPRPEASTLLHGAVVGVPVSKDGLVERVTAADLRPPAGRAELALGEHLYDAVAALTARSAAARLGVTGAEDLAVVERLVTAFVQHALQRVTDPGGAAEIDADVHAEGFATVASGEPPLTDRLVDGKVAVPGRGRRVGHVSETLGHHTVTMTQGYTKAVAAQTLVATEGVAATAERASARTLDALPTATMRPTGAGFAAAVGGARAAKAGTSTTASISSPAAASVAAAAAPRVRTEDRPSPPRYVPSDPYLAVRGAGRSLRHGGDGAWSSQGKLLVRHASQLVPDYHGVLPGSAVLAALPSGAVPAEASALAREALLLSPHLTAWLARRAAERSGASSDAVLSAYAGRLQAEMLLRFDSSGAYSTRAGTAAVSDPVVDAVWRPGDVDADAARISASLREHSLAAGVEPSPVGITAWAQPWAPQWLEFEVEVASTGVSPATTEGWRLATTDLLPSEGSDPSSAPVVRTCVARVPLTTGSANAVGGAVQEYLADEAKRDTKGVGEVDGTMASRLSVLAQVAGSPDLLGAVLDGVRQRVLGLPARAVQGKAADGTALPQVPDDVPVLLLAGQLRVTRARLVDAFGRVLDLDATTAAVPSRLTVDGSPGAVRRAPRFAAPARVRLRLVDAATTSPEGAVDARVDEADATGMVNPVAGFLLPDHVDESFEVFATDGTPLGELLVSGAAGPDGGGVVWEPAPGRPVPVDAPPATGLGPQQAVLAAVASGLVAADASARGGRRADPDDDSALSALLRAVDTTLWTVDPVAAAGSAELAAIVGRPIAVVRAVVEVDVADDLLALALDDTDGPAGRGPRGREYAALAGVEVPVRLGEITRPDDGLLAWFVDDDHSRVHLVDAAVADLAREAGPGRGHLVTYGQTPVEPAVQPITHPYVDPHSELVLRPGVPRLLTLLMAPGAAVHLTSGFVPRSRVALQRSWFAAGLDRLVPSIRVGPVLVDPGDVRLPLVAALGEHQVLTTREGPLGWRDDAILAAGSSALLPDRATVLREGWVRVDPDPEPAPDDGGAS
ncbi:hypothetical protein GCM10027446_03730 [Angustibacter peucedani]